MRRLGELSLPWVDPNQCVHPVPVILLKFNDSDETLYKCFACGETMTAKELKDRRPGSRMKQRSTASGT